MKSRFYNLLWGIVDIIFPPKCAGCGRWGELWCQECEDNSRKIPDQVCSICGEPLANQSKEVCLRCLLEPPSYQALTAWAFFEGPVQHAVHQLKYRKNIGLGNLFASKLAPLVLDKGWKPELVVPVPLHHSRHKERGYNQALIIARPLAQQLQINISQSSLSRERNTLSQVGLPYHQRKRNVSRAFRAESELVSGKKILVVDDVITTGSTMNACAEALINAQAETVFGLSLARAV